MVRVVGVVQDPEDLFVVVVAVQGAVARVVADVVGAHLLPVQAQGHVVVDAGGEVVELLAGLVAVGVIEHLVPVGIAVCVLQLGVAGVQIDDGGVADVLGIVGPAVGDAVLAGFPRIRQPVKRPVAHRVIPVAVQGFHIVAGGQPVFVDLLRGAVLLPEPGGIAAVGGILAAVGVELDQIILALPAGIDAHVGRGHGGQQHRLALCPVRQAVVFVRVEVHAGRAFPVRVPAGELVARAGGGRRYIRLIRCQRFSISDRVRGKSGIIEGIHKGEGLYVAGKIDLCRCCQAEFCTVCRYVDPITISNAVPNRSKSSIYSIEDSGRNARSVAVDDVAFRFPVEIGFLSFGRFYIVLNGFPIGHRAAFNCDSVFSKLIINCCKVSRSQRILSGR